MCELGEAFVAAPELVAVGHGLQQLRVDHPHREAGVRDGADGTRRLDFVVQSAIAPEIGLAHQLEERAGG